MTEEVTGNGDRWQSTRFHDYPSHQSLTWWITIFCASKTQFHHRHFTLICVIIVSFSLVTLLHWSSLIGAEEYCIGPNYFIYIISSALVIVDTWEENYTTMYSCVQEYCITVLFRKDLLKIKVWNGGSEHRRLTWWKRTARNLVLIKHVIIIWLWTSLS